MDNQADSPPPFFNAVRLEADRAWDQPTAWLLSMARFTDIARRVGWADDPAEPAFTYQVRGPAPNRCEKRALPRVRTRLRTGKIMDRHNAFLTECRFHDRSRHGARLELVRAVNVLDGLRVFDDETGLLHAIRPVWLGQGLLGVVLETGWRDPAGAPFGRTHYALP